MNNTGFYIVAFFFVSLLSQAQSTEDVGALEKELRSDTLTEARRVDVLNQLSRSMSFISSRKSLLYASEALRLATENDYSSGVAYAYRNLSSVYSYEESFYLSMEYIQRSLEIFASLGDSVGIANSYISLGHTYRRLRDRPKEIEYHLKAYQFFTRSGDRERIGVTAHNLGESYLNNNELEKSRTLTLFAIKTLDSLRSESVLSSCYKVMGILEYKASRHSEAARYFLKVLEISGRLRQLAQKNATAESMIYLAKIYQAEGNDREELRQLLAAANFSKDNRLYNNTKTAYEGLLSYFTLRNDPKQAQLYLEEYREVSEQLLAKQLQDRSELVSHVVDIHRLENDKQMLAKENLLQAARVQNRTILIGVATGTAFLLLVLIVLIWRTNKRLKASVSLINEQRKQLEDANRTKDKFFSIVAHDLRSPLNSLKSFSLLMIHHLDKISQEDILRMSRELQHSVDNTIKMTDNLITWARLQMNEFETRLEDFVLETVVREVISVSSVAAAQKQLTFNAQIDASLKVHGDKNQVALVIRNLLNNAIKFTTAGGSVTLQAHQELGNVRIDVSDTGFGMSPEYLSSVTSISSKHSRPGTQGEKGTGLGIVLCFEFVKNNKGDLKIQSTEGRGTTVTLTLPAA